ALARRAGAATIASLALIVALVPALLGSTAGTAPPWAASAAAGALAVTGVTAFVGGCMRGVSRPTPWIRFVSEASYWTYIVHLPIVVLLQIALAGLALPGAVKLAAIIAATLATCFASYALAVRWSPLRRVVG